MNYNEYDSNGNKKKFDFLDIINDKTQRSRFILFVYLVIFIVLIIVVRLNLKDVPENKEIEDNKEEVINNIEEEPVIKTNEDFSYIKLNNYSFIFDIKIVDTLSLIEGKRYNDKYSFTVSNNGDVLYFNGTKNYIRAKEEDGEYKLTGFPYILVDYFNNDLLISMIDNSTYVDDRYEITNEKIGKLVNDSKIIGNDINTITLIKKNNIVTQIVLDLSNAVSLYLNDNKEAIITLKYADFGLIDDFLIE